MMIGHLPQYDITQQGVWCESIVNRLEEDLSKRPDELKKFLLDGMVVLSPAQRWSAVGCYDQLLLVCGVGGVSSETPTLGNYAAVMHYREGRRQTNIWPVPTYTSPAQGHEDVVEDEPSTIRQCEYSHGGEAREPTISDGTFVCSTSIDRKKRVRADALLPGTHISKPGSSRKRHTSESPSSESPSRGRHGKRSHRQRAHKQDSSGKETERRSPFVVQESLNPQRTSQSKKSRGTAPQVDRPSEAVHPWDLSERHQLSHTTTVGANVLDVAADTNSATASLLPDDQLHNRNENRVIRSQQSCHGRSVDAQARWSLPGLEEIEPASLLRNLPEDPHPEVQHDSYKESAVLPSVLPAGQPGEAHEADHLSTREIMFDTSSHQVYMVIQQRRVSMRTDDFHLNISQILLVAAVGDYRKRQVTKELKERNIISTDARHYWAPFRHGVFVCQFANFESALMPLLTYAPLPLPERNENYLLALVMRERKSQRPSYPAKLRFRSYAEGDIGGHGGGLDRMEPRGDFACHNRRPKECRPTDHVVRAQPPFDDSRTQQQSMPANSLHEPSIPTHKGEPIRSTEDTNLSAHPGASGLSFDADGLVYMDIRGRRVSMSTPDLQISVSQVLQASDLNRKPRANLRRGLQERGVITSQGRQEWVPFRDGVFACQAAGLDQDLLPLLSYACLPFPDRDDNYLRINKHDRPLMEILEESPDFAGLRIGDHVVAYRPSERTINARHLLASGNGRRCDLTRFLQANPDIITDKSICHRRLQGTYISYEAAQRLCDHLGLSRDPIERLVSEESEEVARSPGIYPERAACYRSEAHGASGSSCDLVDHDLGNAASTMITTYDPAHCDPDTSLLDNSVSVGSWFQLTAQDHGQEAAAFDLDGVRDSSFDVSNAHHGDAVGACSDASHTPILVTPWEDNAGSYRYSQVTERSYADGSYLAPADHSFKQLLE
ncbi:hypothetical protein Purlil1_14102 [Purpureocillium lilacinum]|uniref:Uncharacterized protein n=1 Tax=Purpureocillium lilacinum TaxID=33203 RepID=A0ABR0BC80_PURLI|nr:hypothetical protein Purlil1_14102 [Purpureocillium lilacinum]